VFCVALACGSDATTTEPQDIDLSFANYPTDFPIAVTSGLTPTFSWKDVRGGSLVIDDYNGNTVTQNEPWQFFAANSSTGFSSPVQYGTLPVGASCGLFGESTDNCPVAKPLVRGHLYQLTVITVDYKVGVKFFKP
jgi:hypothetical protein